MKQILSIVILLSLFSSIAIGEDACCSLFEQTEQSSQVESQTPEITPHGFHICENDSEKPSSHDDHNHYCFGCFHSPFLNVEYGVIDGLPLKSQFSRFELFFILLNPYLDGPFQPPKAQLV